MSNNDKRILTLKRNIQSKKEQLQRINSRFTPRTSCVFELDAIKYNLNVLNEEQLILLAIKLNSLIQSAKHLGLLDNFMLNGFTVEEFMKDITAKLENISYKKEKLKLDHMESRLTQLLSEEKQVELEIDEIESML